MNAAPTTSSPAAIPSSQAFASAPGSAPQRDRRDHGRGEERARRRGVAERLRDERGVEQREPAAAVRLGHEDPRRAELGEPAPDRAVVRAVGVAQLAHARDRHAVAQERRARSASSRRWSSESPKSMLVMPCTPSLRDFGSRGSPSPRSAMMFFWICAVPPPMIRPSAKNECACQKPRSRSYFAWS